MDEQIKQIMKVTVEMLAEVKRASDIKVNRSFTEFFASRIRQASTQSSLISFVEKLCNLVNVQHGYVGKDKLAEFIKHASMDGWIAVLQYIRNNHNLVSMIVFIKEKEERDSLIDSLDIKPVSINSGEGKAILRKPFHINIKAVCTSPLIHGDDHKAGNATLFRRMHILAHNNEVLHLPYYAGNAIRGQMRDLLADHFLSILGLTPSRTTPPISTWFFHSLYCGGALSEKTKELIDIDKLAGGSGHKAEGLSKIRKAFPALSILGFAFGNRVMKGQVGFSDFRPECREWGYDTELSASDLFEWSFLTRREDLEGYEDGDNSSMIATAECLKSGTVLNGGIDIDDFMTEIEKSCLITGLKLLQKDGKIGAENRRGMGNVDISFYIDDSVNFPDETLYEEYLKENKERILSFMEEISAIKPIKNDNSEGSVDDDPF